MSVWARKNVFLWAVLPPAAVPLLEGVVLQSHHFAEFLGRRFGGVVPAHGPDAFNMRHAAMPALGDDPAPHRAVCFVIAETWLGVLAAAAIVYAVIRIRRYRDDS